MQQHRARRSRADHRLNAIAARAARQSERDLTLKPRRARELERELIEAGELPGRRAA